MSFLHIKTQQSNARYGGENKDSSKPPQNQRIFGREISNVSTSTSSSTRHNSFQARDQSSKIFSSVEGQENNQSILEKPNTATSSSTNPNNQLQKFPMSPLKFQKEINAINRYEIDQLDTHMVDKQLTQIQIEDQQYPNRVPEYATIIFEYLRKREMHFLINANFMQRQEDINEQMRSILVDWLVQAHLKFKLLSETLFMAVGLVDRYLEKNSIQRSQFQLLGISALFMASQYEEIYPPNLKEFITIGDYAYTKAEILDMESKIIIALDFSLTWPSSLRFFERYSRVVKLEPGKPTFFCLYLIELALMDSQLIKYSPSLIACGSIYLCNQVFKKSSYPGHTWSDTIAHHSGHTETQIRPCSKELCLLLQAATQLPQQAIRKKYASTKFSEISRISIEPQCAQ